MPSSTPSELGDPFDMEEGTEPDSSVLPTESDEPEISDLDEDFLFSGNIEDYFTVEPTFIESEFDLIDDDIPIESGESIEVPETPEILEEEQAQATVIPLCTGSKRNCLRRQRCGFLIQRRRGRRLNRRGRRLLQICSRRCRVKAEFC